VLTIAGERLELARFMPPSPRARNVFLVIVGAMLLAVLGSWLSEEGLRFLGATLAALAVWLLRQDVARRTVLQSGLTRFIAVCLLSGYVWLLLGGVLLAWQPASGFVMDAVLHAVFVGFVLAMVFGHAPIIFPAVVRVALPYHAAFYLPLAGLASVAAVAGVRWARWHGRMARAGGGRQCAGAGPVHRDHAGNGAAR
jgi:hypothetical protein